MSNYIMDLRKEVGHRPLLQVGASVIVEDSLGRILLQLRSDNHCWGYAGGSVELDEEVEEAAKRELFEETGLIAEELTLFGVFSGRDTHYIYPNGDEVSNVDIVYICKKYSGNLKCQDGEVDKLAFFDADNLPENISPPLRRATRKWLKSKLHTKQRKVMEKLYQLADVTMNIKYPDYKNSIANLGCSILKYFGIEPPNSTLPAADALFNKRYKNVVVLLLDGMGVNILKKHLSPDGFFLRNMVCEYSSTFPPTTVAATTAIDSGLFPNQSAWLGWTGYFEEIDKNVVYFLNVDNDTKVPISDINVAHTFLPYESLLDAVRATGAETYRVAPYFDSSLTTFSALCEKVKSLCSTDSPKYIYAYWDNPDAAMHKNGTDGSDIRDMMNDLQEQAQNLADALTDTLLIITADHGHINVKNTVITDYPDICECLLRMPSMEVRALNIFVKPSMENKFETAFNSHFSNEFMLLSKKEVYARKLLGMGKNHPRLDKMLGDYLAVAVSDLAINNVKRNIEHMGEHAGITDDEMTIPLIAIQK